MKSTTKNLVLFAVVIILIVSPLLFIKGAEFSGADGQAEEAITEIDPNYEPWFSPLIEPASGEIESLMFAVQAAIGAGIIGYFFGYVKGKRSSSINESKAKK